MNLELHHFFILVAPGGAVAEKLQAIGMNLSVARSHPGQGTTNKRFDFANTSLELLWVHDETEARDGPGRGLRLAERAKSKTASPFGLVFTRKSGNEEEIPFPGWTYQPDYFPPPRHFHIGANSENLAEPLCIYMPFIQPGTARGGADNPQFGELHRLGLDMPVTAPSEVLRVIGGIAGLSLAYDTELLLKLEFGAENSRKNCDFRPHLPLAMSW